MPKRDLAKRKEWKKKMEAWQASGLSGPKWCIENNENYPRFQYWKSVLQITPPCSSFRELKEESPEPIEIELRQGDVTISFPKGCNASLLELCLKSLRKIDCLQ